MDNVLKMSSRLIFHWNRKNLRVHINGKATKQIGLTIPQSLLYRADKVIK